jgi:FlaG/FlaF family flagellin (archaellin)
MNFDVRKRKSWKEDEGVSEIIGNILILMITVILFTGIMAFVQQMPVPHQATKVDFSASVSFSPTGSTANLTVTHAGGAVMQTTDTFILVSVDSVNKRFNMSDPVLGLKGVTQWTTGQSWTATLNGTTYTSAITVTVVDNVKHEAIWTSQVTGGHGGNPPSILQRYVDSDTTTATADPVKEHDDFSFFATITDSDNDLNTTNGIWIDTSQITKYANAHWEPDHVNGNVYIWDFTGIIAKGINASDLDGAVIVIHAWDKANHQSMSTFVISVLVLPVENHWTNSTGNTEEPPSGDSNLPSYIRWFYDNQGFGIFAEAFNGSVALGKADTSAIVTSFAKDHWIFVRFASKIMTNTFVENRLILTDIRTGLAITPRFNESAGATAAKPFYGMVGSGGIYIYETQFNTSTLPPGAYDMQISIKNQPSTGEPQRSYGGDKTIFVTDPSSPIQFYPQIFLYQDASHLVWWGDRYHPYQVSSSNAYTMYVAIQVQDTDNPPTPSVADLRITDGAKNAEVYGVPPSGNMISTMGRFDIGSDHYYNFSIDLRLNNGVQWRSGNNSYTLIISKLNDSNEGMYSLSEQVFIVGAGTRADFFVGTTGMASGNSNFNTREYAYYIQNNIMFGARVLYQSDTTPGSGTDYTVTAMGVGDIDGDGDRDLLMARCTNSGNPVSYQLFLFENTLNTFGTWQSGSVISRPDSTIYYVSSIAFGDVNGDGHDDFAYSNSNGQIVIYNTTYGSQGWIYTPPTGKGWTAPISKISLKDMTGDGKADLVVLAGAAGSRLISVYDLKYTYDPLLKSQEVAKGRVAVSAGATLDYDLDDMNNDSKVDIVTTGTSAAFGGYNGVNVNYYTSTYGTNNVKLDAGASGYNPKMSAGNWNNTTSVGNTYSLMDGTSIFFRENGTLTPSDPGRVIATMKFLTLSNNPDQELRIRARVGAINNTADEIFYCWYSTDNIAYIPILTIDSSTWKNYSYMLPSSVANKPIYLRFTDSITTNTSGNIVSFIQVDMALVYTNTFAGYVGTGVVNSATWTSVRAAAIDGPFTAANPYKEVVVAKHSDTVAANSVWNVYKYTTSWTLLSGTPPGDISFFQSSSSKVAAGFFDNTAPTLFRAVDINGDGLTDIMVTNYTTTGGTYNSYIGFYMNLWTGSSQYYRYYSVKSWLIDPPTGSAKDPWIDIATVINLTVV